MALSAADKATSGSFSPPFLFAYRTSVVGTEVICDLIKKCHSGANVPDHYREQMMWLATFALLDVVKSVEQHFDNDLRTTQRAHWGKEHLLGGDA